MSPEFIVSVGTLIGTIIGTAIYVVRNLNRNSDKVANRVSDKVEEKMQIPGSKVDNNTTAVNTLAVALNSLTVIMQQNQKDNEKDAEEAEQEKEALLIRLQSNESRLSSYAKTVDELINAQKKKDTESSRRDREISDLRKEISQMGSTISNTNTELEKTRNNLTETSHLLEETRGELVRERKARLDASTRMEEIERLRVDERQALLQEKSDLQLSLNRKDIRILELEEEVKVLTKRVADLERQLSDLINPTPIGDLEIVSKEKEIEP